MLDWLRRLFGRSPKVTRVATDTSPDGTYSELRHGLLSYTRADLDLPAPPPDAPVWNVMMETGYPGVTATVAASAGGATSLYVSSGYFHIGSGDHESVRQAAAKFVETANRLRQHLTPCESCPIPETGQTIFYVSTDSGILAGGAPEDDLGNDRHPLSPLFHAGHEVLSQLFRRAEEVEREELLGVIAAYDRAISGKPADAALYCERGDVYAQLGQLDKAVADYDKALSLKPGDAGTFNSRGYLHMDSGDLASALADFDRAIALDPTNAMAYANRGGVHSRTGDVQRALADYESAIGHDPEYPNTYANRAFAYYKLGEYEKGIADCDKALALRPDHAATYSNRGLCRAALGDAEGAAADFRRALELPCPPDVFEEALSGLRALARDTGVEARGEP